MPTGLIPQGRFAALFLAATLLIGEVTDPNQLLQQAKQLLHEHGGKPQAITFLRQANRLWSDQSSDAPEYAESLDLLALTLKSLEGQDWRDQAAPLTARSLAIRESHADTKPEDLALALELRADALDRQGEGAEDWARATIIRSRRVAEISAAAQAETPAGTGEPEPIRNGVTPPQIIAKSEPEYTEEAIQTRLNATVTLSIVIDERGLPGHILLIRGVGYGLDEAAAQAVLKWRFKPGAKGGQPVKVKATLQVNFRILPTS